MPFNQALFVFNGSAVDEIGICEAAHATAARKAFPFATESQISDLAFNRMMLWNSSAMGFHSLITEDTAEVNRLFGDLVRENDRFHNAAQKVANFFGCAIEHAGETFIPEGNLI